MSTTRFDPDELATLESEREFLLRSLTDLESERAAGNLDDDRYRALKDDYTTRAAAVLRSIEEGADIRPAPSPVPLRRKLAVGSGLVAFAVVAGVLLAGALGERLPGDSVTGNAQSDRRAALERQAAEHPDSAAARRAYARFLFRSDDPGDWATAIGEFDAAARLDPGDAESLAYGGWLAFLLSRSVASGDGLPEDTAAQVVDAALRRLDDAVAADPGYPDAHFFRGMVLLRGKNDPAAAVPELERYLALVPDGAQTDEVRKLLEQARTEAAR